MKRKTIATVLTVGVAVLLVVALRTANRADAAAGDCFSDSAGPATPTICN
jgi:hypothetical protein